MHGPRLARMSSHAPRTTTTSHGTTSAEGPLARDMGIHITRPWGGRPRIPEFRYRRRMAGADPAQRGRWVARVPTLWGVGLHPSPS